MLNRRHLRQFLALVDTGSFTAAANQLHVAQPTLSAGIAELERALGAPVIVRERRALRLTEAGNRLLVHARTIEREFGLAERGVRESPRPAPPLRLGVIPSLATRMVAGIAARFSPGRLTLTEAPDADLRRRLAEHRIDAALTLLHGAETSAEVLLEEGYAMVLPAAHRFAARDMLLPEELAGEAMIARRSCEILAETSRFFTARGVRPHFAFRGGNDDRCLALVAAGAGVTTAPVSLAGPSQTPGTVAVALQGYDYRRRIGLIVAGGQEAAVAASGLMPALREVLVQA